MSTSPQSTPIIIYRRLDSNYEPQFNGPGLTNKEAVAQAILTRLKLLEGEWWENLNDGLPLFQNILGHAGNNQQAINLLIQRRIVGTPFVINVSNVQSSFGPSRKFTFSCQVLTAFGSIFITNAAQNFPMPPPQGVLPE